ncbi:MAG: DUF4199 domain-containing protein [Xanthomonadales bacterium]|nr:DUF4199 domain-containing protein [Xanthomonadales bacterium]
MRKTVLIFGLIAGAILSAALLVTIPFHDRIGFDLGMVIGYASMVAAFLLIFFGVRSYRDNVAGGRIGFGRAFSVGALIALVASLCYVATWQVLYFKIAPDFMDKLEAHMVAEARRDGASPEQIAKTEREMREFAVLYSNPAFNAAITLIEPLPVGIVISLVSAGVLSRRRRPLDDTAPATA